MSHITVAFKTDTRKHASYSFPPKTPFEDVIDRFCEDFNLAKEETTFFGRYHAVGEGDMVEDAHGEVFVATEGRFLRSYGYCVTVRNLDRKAMGVCTFGRLPSKAELFEGGAKFCPAASEFTLLTIHGRQSIRKNDTQPLKDDDLRVDRSTGYPVNYMAIIVVAEGSCSRVDSASSQASITVAFKTDTDKHASYSFPPKTPFDMVIDSFCKDFNLKKDETTFFLNDQVIADGHVEDVEGAQVFVATEGRLLRPKGYSVTIVAPNFEMLGSFCFQRLPSRAELFEAGAKFYPAASEFLLGTKHGLQSARKNDTRPLKDDDLIVDRSTGYPSTQMVLMAVPKDSSSPDALCALLQTLS